MLFSPPLTGPPIKIDLHIYRPKDLKGDGLAKIIRQAWETGAEKLCLVHGHGRSRGRSPGFYNTKTGRFGLIIRGRFAATFGSASGCAP
ncbi:MAG: hypothetical protein K2Y27_23245 [Xanthobacteraceae bacterium]|nr:hypothetical protein [Xanthobacteraceae bacterium]